MITATEAPSKKEDTFHGVPEHILASHQVTPLCLELSHLLPQPSKLLLGILCNDGRYRPGHHMRRHPLYNKVSMVCNETTIHG